MSVREFSAVVQSEVYKKWLEKLEANIVTATAKSMRESEQRAEKTDFYITDRDIKSMYKNLTGRSLRSAKAKQVIDKIAKIAGSSLIGDIRSVGKDKGVFFTNIGFGTITDRVASVFDELNGVSEAYAAAAKKYLDTKAQELASSSLSAEEQEQQLNRARLYSKTIGFGEFFHKGHVVSIATNTAKAFRESLVAAAEFEQAQKDLLLEVLDRYIARLQKEDLATANLPKALQTEVYAEYTKDNKGKYLVEIQLKSTNLASGAASSRPIEELRKVFGNPSGDLSSILGGSSTLGIKLLNTKGSPSWIDLLSKALADTISSGSYRKESYSVPSTLIGKNKTPINTLQLKKDIAKLKEQRSKIASAKSKIKIPVLRDIGGRFYSLASLQRLLDANLAQKIKENMGSGRRRDVLNLRSGRFAESAKVERLSQSREGMITAFYTYMKNPYQTFEPGFKQGSPSSRNPKLLISKSIREIAATQVANRMRAVLV